MTEQWWVWALVTAGAGTVAWIIRVVVKLIIQPTQQIIRGDMVPRITLDLMVHQFEERLAAKDKELDKVWTAYHLEASANQQAARGETEQSTVTAQSVMALMESLQRARADTIVEVAASENGSANHHPGTRSTNRSGT